MNKIILISAGVVILLIIFMLFNKLIKKRNQVQNIFGSLDAILKKRYDLIPNLISAVKEYMTHESSVLSELTAMRAKALNPDISQDDKIKIQKDISQALGNIMIAVEAYPDLKAGQNFLQLQGALNEVEEQISAARRAYNAAVTDYNNAVQTIPSNIVALFIGFKKKPVLETPEIERENVSVKDLFNS